MTGKYLILGAGGQLARAFAAHYGSRALMVSQAQLDFTARDFHRAFQSLLQSENFSAVINAAAYTQVDKAENEGMEEAFCVNAKAVIAMAHECAKMQMPFVHYSTDYVFNGTGSAPWTEDDAPEPVNAYGASKYSGEKEIPGFGGPHLIFRTSWLYDAQGRNFFNTMLRLFSEKEEINVVADQIGAPTYVPHLARASALALEKALAMRAFPSGVYHLCSGGETSWHGFAEAIFALARSRDFSIRCSRIRPIASSEYKTPAARPLNSRLDCGKARTVFGAALPDWREGLKECFEEKYGRLKRQDLRS